MTFLFTFSFQSLTPRPSPLTPALSTTVESPLQIRPFLTNKPNFPKSQVNVIYVIIKDYGDWTLGRVGKTNPIQSQYKPKSNPIQSQFKPNTKPIQTQFLYHCFCLLFTIASKCKKFAKELCICLPIILLFKSV
jgi:hypothetical protein